ncbi:DEAD/DEAH box helicase family protein [Microbulbifer sp. SA54]|uniref:DEAD/DEAH box helicase family protein n=1 Tax=Microbulbifer sp. SA54 TaxID=3401577 RepID=UPI003AAE4618
MSLRPIDLDTARRILDFSGGDKNLASLGELQLEGAVALYNMIADRKVGIGYLADEVGMGKTYIALGVVALMRYFNPTLRVLYICPSNNVQEKWHAREYRSFCKHNVRVNQYRVRTPDGKSAAPAISCRSVTELIRHAATGYYADFFVGMNAFSLALSKDDKAAWKAKLRELHQLLPAFEIPTSGISSMAVKDKYAEALNYVLPSFDLVVIDEAHNFKHDFESSHRNRVLSAALGFREGKGQVQRVKNALLLSATPYDRNINQLRNQLRLVGHGSLLPDEIAHDEKDRVEVHLSRFMVRRLNVLQIAGKDHTRNMYRNEWRSGERAEIRLTSDEQKLVTALVQKKVGEMLVKKNGSPSFQTGLLASFESYAESTRSGPVEFDGELAEKDGSDAQDKHVIAAISDSYIQSDLGRTLPHPKMDSVSQQLAEELFHRSRKQIVFVRRVKSVKEIKRKLDDLYNEWLSTYILSQLNAYPEAYQCMDGVIGVYLECSRFQDEDISGGDYVSGDADETDDRQPPKKDTLFAWFFRGELAADAAYLFDQGQNSLIVPEAMRKGLVAKNQSVSLLLEINWANLLAHCLGEDLEQLLQQHGEEICGIAAKYIDDASIVNWQSDFVACQLAFLVCLARHRNLPGLQQLVDHLEPSEPATNSASLSLKRCTELLQTHTLYCALCEIGLLDELFPRVFPLLEKLIASQDVDREQFQTLDIHSALLSLCLRTGHGLVDLYLARIRRGSGDLSSDSRAEWMDDLASVLSRQSGEKGFNTYWECRQLALHLDLIIKTNFPGIYDKSSGQYRLYLARSLNPVAPIMGATGDTASTRSAQARKFRMPGYPLALISTDVFQEGEDLHTFCDSVMHYGLSGSPVSIEQKIGRVDRVGSQAQRRLLALEKKVAPADDDFIQVTYPFVRESIEVFQVRQLCHNINDFIESLNTLGAGSHAVLDHIDADAAVADRSEIPEQIRSFLKSPYLPLVTERDSALSRKQFVEGQALHTQRVIDNIGKLLAKKFGRSSVLDAEGIHIPLREGNSTPAIVSLRAARASSEMLLHVFWEGETVFLRDMDRSLLRERMQYSWRTYFRTYAKETAHRTLQLGYDAELLVGDEEATSREELDSFFNRFQQTHDPNNYHKPTSNQVLRYWSKAARQGKADFGQFPAQMDVYEKAKELGITFRFGVGNQERKHHVRIYELDGRCIFLAQAASANRVESLSIDQIVRFTWLFNSNIDLAEFMLDDRMALIGRTVHPVNGMDYKEFVYCAYTLAVTTDRLEFLIQRPDRY